MSFYRNYYLLELLKLQLIQNILYHVTDVFIYFAFLRYSSHGQRGECLYLPAASCNRQRDGERAQAQHLLPQL